ncbi:MAG TPA: hypothetical protein VF604_17455 [Pyrinomonadaceae bacterium]|jgi:hypothetical protein
MKNFAFTLFLAFVFVFSLSVNTFAEGEIPTMGRTCPTTTTCLADGEIPISGKSLVDTQAPTQTEEATIFKTVIDYLSQLFG